MSAPKVVMLVDNTVDGDSRVQKSARFMASLGWDVTLVGRSPTAQLLEEELGDASLLRVPTTMPLSNRRRLAPGRSLRRPLAYPNRDVAAAAEAMVRWRRIQLQTRLATEGRAATFVSRALEKVRRTVHRTRARQFRAASRAAGATRDRAPLPRRRAQSQWALDDPMLADLEVAFAPVLTRLAPDIVHAHDFRTIGIAVRYKQRMAATGKAPVVVYDAHEYLKGVGIADARRRRGDETYESVHMPGVDGVICVAPRTGAELVKLYGLEREPLVVLNTPFAASGRWADDAPDVRSAAGVPEGAPLVVYVGVAAAKRGIGTVAASLPELPGVHLVLVTKRNDFLDGLEQDAAAAGCADRFHVLPYVDPDDVSSFVRTADVGVSVMSADHLNHHYSLPTKIFEYAQGRVPVVTSDVLASKETVHAEGIGTSFPAGDAVACAEAIRTVLADRERFTAPYEKTDLLSRWTWEAQCGPVDALYRELLGHGPSEASLRQARVEQALAEGAAPATDDVLATTRDLLAQADVALAAGDLKTAAAEAARAQGVLFHRTLHFDQAESPLAADAAGFLAPWHESAVGAAVTARVAPAVTWQGRPDRLAILSYKNMTFVPPLERALSELGVGSHRVDLADVAPGGVPLSPLQQLGARLRGPATGPWTAELDAALGDADAVLVDWGQRGAVAASLPADRTRRTIVRLHSFEAFTVFPHLVDWSAVDDLVFVGPHLRDLLVPQLRGFDPATTATHVLPISVDAGHWLRPKSEQAARTLAVVGWAAPAKDAVWALDLLAALRADDPSYRLLLVGKEPAADGPAGVRQYREAVLARLEQADVAGAVERVAFTPDVATLLQDVGWVVSSSVRESLHLAVVEGAASGAVPVVRDWPMLKAYDGPRQLFPADWVVDDLDAAVARVRATAEDRDAHGAAAASAAKERFDDAVARDALAALLDRPCRT
jgi:glycosyltransferase involved in cell wall biosynthesis